MCQKYRKASRNAQKINTPLPIPLGVKYSTRSIFTDHDTSDKPRVNPGINQGSSHIYNLAMEETSTKTVLTQCDIFVIKGRNTKNTAFTNKLHSSLTILEFTKYCQHLNKRDENPVYFYLSDFFESWFSLHKKTRIQKS